MNAVAVSLADNSTSQIAIAILASLAFLAILQAVTVLPIPTRTAFSSLAVVVFMLAFTYWADVFSLVPLSTVRDWRRGVGFILYPSMTWCARAAVHFWRNEAKVLREIINGS